MVKEMAKKYAINQQICSCICMEVPKEFPVYFWVENFCFFWLRKHLFMAFNTYIPSKGGFPVDIAPYSSISKLLIAV